MDIAARSESYLHQGRAVGKPILMAAGTNGKSNFLVSWSWERENWTTWQRYVCEEKASVGVVRQVGWFWSGGNRGARCQLRQNSFLGLSSKDGIWGQCNDIGAQIAHFFLYRMDIRVGQCVSQASQRQSPSAKLFCFIAPPFPAISPTTQTSSLTHFTYQPDLLALEKIDHLSYDPH